MTDNVKEHPYSELLREAEHERGVAESPEGRKLLEVITRAVEAYSAFLDRHGLIFDDDRMKASALVITYTCGMGTIDVTLKDGAIDRVYGNGTNPDPDGRGPPEIPHEYRRDELLDP
jgi:hypothetical protein